MFSHAVNDTSCASVNVYINTIKQYAIAKHKAQHTHISIANGYIMYFIPHLLSVVRDCRECYL